MLGRTSDEWRALIRRLVREMVKFGMVGVVGFVVDVGLFNLLASTAAVHDSPLVAKVISVTVATAVTFVGNRYFVFQHRRGAQVGKEIALFALFSVTGMLIAVGTLWFSHYVLGYTSLLADNISANVIGLGLATAFRFATYRTFVFRGVPVPVADDSVLEAPASA